MPTADSLLSNAIILARALATATTDSLWIDAVESLVRSNEKQDLTRLRAATRGLIAWATGNVYSNEYRLDSAASWFAEAEAALTKAQNAARYRVAYDRAWTLIFGLSFQQARTAFRQVRTTAPARYRVVRVLAPQAERFAGSEQADYAAAKGGVQR